MNKKFKEYLEDIGMTRTLINKVEEEHNVLLRLFDFDCEDLIVEDYINEDGSKVYKNILLFCENYIHEVTDFIEKPKYSKTYMADQVNNIEVQIKDFIIGEKTKRNSVIKIQLYRKDSEIRIYEINGTGENCKYIIDILRNYIDTCYSMKKDK